jgi:hypothetical protein
MTVLILVIAGAVLMKLLWPSKNRGTKPCRRCKGQKVVASRRWFHKRCLDTCARCEGTGKEITLLTRMLDGNARRKARNRRRGRGRRGLLAGFLLGRPR